MIWKTSGSRVSVQELPFINLTKPDATVKIRAMPLMSCKCQRSMVHSHSGSVGDMYELTVRGAQHKSTGLEVQVIVRRKAFRLRSDLKLALFDFHIKRCTYKSKDATPGLFVSLSLFQGIGGPSFQSFYCEFLDSLRDRVKSSQTIVNVPMRVFL